MAYRTHEKEHAECEGVASVIYILILNVLLLICEWIAGYLALKAGQVSVTVAIAFIMCLQSWLIYTVLLLIKNQNQPKQEEMN